MSAVHRLQRRVTEVLNEYKRDPEGGHAGEDELLWDFVWSEAAAGNPYARALSRLDRTPRTRWYA